MREEYLTYVPNSNDIIIKQERQIIEDFMNQESSSVAPVVTTAVPAEQRSRNNVPATAPAEPTRSISKYEQTNIIRYLDVSLLGRACFNIQTKKWYLFLGTLDDDDILKYSEQEHHSKESDLYRSINILTKRKREAQAEPGIKEISASSGTADLSITNGEFIDMLMAGKISVLNRTDKQYRSVKGYTRHWIKERKIFNISYDQQEEEESSIATD